MLPQTEDPRPTRGPTLPWKDEGVRKGWRRPWFVWAIALVVVAVVLLWGIRSRVRAGRTARAEAAQSAVTPVSVILPTRAAPAQEVILPGNVQPFSSSPIYSRTNGYLRKWYVDIGARVKQGQLLAVIDAPEVDQQVEQSISNLDTTKANLALAEITKNRYQALLTKKAVSQQDVDNAVGTYNANKSIVEADQANVKQLQALQSFEKIYAPFAGVVTARNTDIGDLVNSGSAGGVKTDLFHIAQPGTLRVYVNVPEEYSQGIKEGMNIRAVELQLSDDEIRLLETESDPGVPYPKWMVLQLDTAEDPRSKVLYPERYADGGSWKDLRRTRWSG